MIRKYPCSASGKVGWSELRERTGRLQPCRVQVLFYVKVSRGKKWFPMGFFLPPGARGSSSERVTGPFTATCTKAAAPQSSSNPQRLLESSVVEIFWVILFFSSFLLSSCFRAKSEVWPFTAQQKHMGSQEFTGIIHISTYNVYTEAFSPPRVKMFVQSITRLGVPELVSPRCEYFIIMVFIFPLFFPYLCVSLCWCMWFHTAQRNLQRRPHTSAKKCFICHDRFVQKKGLTKTQCLYPNGKVGATLHTLKSAVGGKKKTRAGKLMLNSLYMLLSV